MNKAFQIKIKVFSPFLIFLRNYAQLNKNDYKKYYALLGVPENCTEEDIRHAFIKLAKRFHPDSKTEEANAEKFKEIETAFRELKKVARTAPVEEVVPQETDIKHIAPQHRQYLSFEGVGTGTPYQRQKEYEKKRAMDAADNVLQHRITKQSVTAEDKKLSTKKSGSNPNQHKIKTKYGIDRIVEDLIQESMSKGEFNNLPGIGKPLKLHQDTNPYVDFTTHKLNQVLIENGFTPEWITLSKDIREEVSILKEILRKERVRFNSLPLSEDEEDRWEIILRKHEDKVRGINKKIQDYNLVVPLLQKQMVNINIVRFGREILKEGQQAVVSKKNETKPRSVTRNEEDSSSNSIISKRWVESKSILKFIGSFINL